MSPVTFVTLKERKKIQNGSFNGSLRRIFPCVESCTNRSEAMLMSEQELNC